LLAKIEVVLGVTCNSSILPSSKIEGPSRGEIKFINENNVSEGMIWMMTTANDDSGSDEFLKMNLDGRTGTHDIP